MSESSGEDSEETASGDSPSIEDPVEIGDAVGSDGKKSDDGESVNVESDGEESNAGEFFGEESDNEDADNEESNDGGWETDDSYSGESDAEDVDNEESDVGAWDTDDSYAGEAHPMVFYAGEWNAEESDAEDVDNGEADVGGWETDDSYSGETDAEDVDNEEADVRGWDTDDSYAGEAQPFVFYAGEWNAEESDDEDLDGEDFDIGGEFVGIRELVIDDSDAEFDIEAHEAEAAAPRTPSPPLTPEEEYMRFREIIIRHSIDIKFNQHLRNELVNKSSFSEYFDRTKLPISTLSMAQLMTYLQQKREQRDKAQEFIWFAENKRTDHYLPCIIDSVQEEKAAIEDRIRETEVEIDFREF